MGTHIDKMAAAIEHLAGMDMKIPNDRSVALFVFYISAQDFGPVCGAIKTISGEHIN